MAPHVSTDTLKLMNAAVQKALLALAFAFEDNGRPDTKAAVLQLRKQLIDSTGGRWAR